MEGGRERCNICICCSGVRHCATKRVSESLPSRFRVASESLPSRFRVASESLLSRFRVASESLAASARARGQKRSPSRTAQWLGGMTRRRDLEARGTTRARIARLSQDRAHRLDFVRFRAGGPQLPGEFSKGAFSAVRGTGVWKRIRRQGSPPVGHRMGNAGICLPAEQADI